MRLRYGSDGKLKKDGICSLRIRAACAFRSVHDRLSHFGARRLAAVLVICALSVFAISRMNIALAVSVEGDFVGYASSRSELDSIISKVRSTTESVFGSECGIEPDVTCHVSFGKAEPGIADALESRIYSEISEINSLYIVYADGEPVCAFSSAKDASDAIASVIDGFVTENTVSAEFSCEVSVCEGYAGMDMLENNLKALHDALSVITVDRDVVEQTVKYSTSYVLDNDMLESQSEVITPGQNGTFETVYLVTRENGVLSSYEKIESTLIQAPVPCEVRVGTLPSYSTGSYIWPCDGYISSRFGARRTSVGSSNHAGIDIAGHYGDKIWAADGGEVIFADEYSGYGLLIQIRHDNGDVTYYAHCSALLAEVGDIVKQGQVIAEMGSTGVASGVHCHFELRPGGGKPVDAAPYLPEGVLDTLIVSG